MQFDWGTCILHVISRAGRPSHSPTLRQYQTGGDPNAYNRSMSAEHWNLGSRQRDARTVIVIWHDTPNGPKAGDRSSWKGSTQLRGAAFL